MAINDDISSNLEQHPFNALKKLIETLRGGQGCPWDRKQTPKSISVYLTEEIYELADAIASGDPDDIRDELGDVLFQVFFIAGIYQEAGIFDIAAVVRENVKKMIRRHPHVFGPEKLANTEQIRTRWHQIKQKEKAGDKSSSTLGSVPVHLPGLMRAYRISERAARTGFDWQDTAGVVEKVEEEWAELKAAIGKMEGNQVDDEFGDLLFTLVNLARFLKIHPETSLTDSTHKFMGRFTSLEKLVSQRGQRIDTLSPRKLDELWEQVKSREKEAKSGDGE